MWVKKNFYFFLGKVDNGKFPKLLTLDKDETNIGENTTGNGTSILAESQPEREIKKEIEIDGKDFHDKGINNIIGEYEHQSHKDKNLCKAEKLAGEKTLSTTFSEDEDEKDNSNLEPNPFIKLELCEVSLEVKYNVSQDATNTANDDCGDLIVRDLLSFAWQIARGMVSNEPSLSV